MPGGLYFARYASPLEIGFGLLLLGILTLVFSPFYPYGALALVALVAVRNGVREGLTTAVCAWGLYLALAWGRSRGAWGAMLQTAETYATLVLLVTGGVAFGAIGLGHRRALRALQQRVDELELELADQGVRFLEALEEKQALEQRLAKDRSTGPGA